MRMSRRSIQLKNSRGLEMHRDEFIGKAIDVPWMNRACSFGGMDCWGLVSLYFQHVHQLMMPAPIGYDDNDEFERCFDNEVTKWSLIESPKDDCLIVCYYGKHPIHVGVVMKDKVLHSRGENGRVTLDKLLTIQRLYTRVEYYEYSNNRSGEAGTIK